MSDIRKIRPPAVTDGVVVDGAAIDFECAVEAAASLPPLLRHAIRAIEEPVGSTLAVEVAVLAPELANDAVSWAAGETRGEWRKLASSLDQAAVLQNSSAIRTLADVVRFSSMTGEEARLSPADVMDFVFAFRESSKVASRNGAKSSHLAAVEFLALGWTAMAAGDAAALYANLRSGHACAYDLGRSLTHAIRSDAAEASVAQDARREGAIDADDPFPFEVDGSEPTDLPRETLVVCPLLDLNIARIRDTARIHDHALGVALPLTPVGNLKEIRRELAQEFPYAREQIDRLLTSLVGRTTVFMPPTIVAGSPGIGKSRLTRRLAELLGVGLWRMDAARIDGAAFGGTDRRWATTECCHPFIAVSRYGTANPMVLVDELDKACTRRDHGRLWDTLLAFLEPETARAYPDPCLQVDLDLSHVTFLMTCNDVAGLPAELVDRCRVIDFPAPSRSDLDLLLSCLLRDRAVEMGLDPRWIDPLGQGERAVLARRWRGGSVRHLRRLFAAVMSGRDLELTVH